MRTARTFLLASTILSLGAAPLVPLASAAPLQGEVLAQANPPKKPGEREPPPKPPAPKPPSHPAAPVPRPPQPHPAPPPRPSQPVAPLRRIEPPPPKREAPPPIAPPANERRQTNAPAKQPLPPPTIPRAARPNPPPGPAGKVQPQQPAPSVVRRAAPNANPGVVAPPTQAIGKQQFMAPRGQKPAAGINQLRSERREVRQGNQIFIQEPGRTIIEQGNRAIIRHNEVNRFAVDARSVHVERRGNDTVTIVLRPDGVQIINITDDRGYLLRRVRRNPDGREFVIIDNSFAGLGAEAMFVDVPPPVIRIPRDRYILDADAADEALIYGVLLAPPVERIDRRYTLDQVLYSQYLRARMPRIDLDVNFDIGSWQITSDQVDRLAFVAQAFNQAVARDPREVFLIEGHTDAVGSAIDNLSLSDRRAETVAVALTEQFGVPAENLVSQGYGEQDLKVPTNGPSRANRRVSIRRITPLINR